jgi:outer membrane biosynthesis protein TonB
MSTMEKFCPTTEVLAGWLQGTLDSQQRGHLTSHLAACDECRRAVAIASSIDAPPAAPLNEILLSRVVAASRPRRVLPFAAAAAAVLAAAIGFSLTPKHVAPPSAPTVAVDRAPVAPAGIKPGPRPEEPRTVTPVPTPTPPTPPVDPQKPAVAVETTPKTPEKPVAAEKIEKPAPVAPDVVEKPVVKETPPPVKAPVDVLTLAPVFVIDPVGDLWLKRDQAEAKAVSLEKAAYKDKFSTRNGTAAFTLEARTSVMLEKNSEVAFWHQKTDDVYSLALDQGLVMLDTEGSSQKWQISFGNSKLDYNNLNGRLVVESRGDRMSALLLDGTADLKIGSMARKALVGQEVEFSREGTVVEHKVETQKKLARLDELRPKVFTAFSSSFDEKSEDFQPYPYAVVAGKRALGPSGFYLQADAALAQKPGEKSALSSEIHLDRAFGVVSGMVIKFRYRTNLPAFSLKIGNYSADFASRVRAGQWGDGEIPLGAFSFEGTPMLPSDPVENVRFAGVTDRKNGQLDIDGVQFLRRVK